MSTTKRRFNRKAGVAIGAAALLVIVVIAALLLRGQGLGLWRVAHLAQAVIDHQAVVGQNHGEFTNVIFVHLSTGRYLLEQGGVRETLAADGYQFWDHDYYWIGLRDPAGEYRGYSYNVPDNNTNPDGLATLFAQQSHDLPLNAFSGLLQHEVIAFKSCFPVSHIASEEQLAQYKAHYLAMRDVMDQHRDKVFVVMSPPPLNPASTDPEAAARARAFAEWLQSDEYLEGHPNLFAFDLFGHLAEDDPASPEYNMLRASYRQGEDSHPNQVANETVGPLFAESISAAAEKYRAIYEPEMMDQK